MTQQHPLLKSHLFIFCMADLVSSKSLRHVHFVFQHAAAVLECSCWCVDPGCSKHNVARVATYVC